MNLHVIISRVEKWSHRHIGNIADGKMCVGLHSGWILSLLDNKSTNAGWSPPAMHTKYCLWTEIGEHRSKQIKRPPLICCFLLLLQVVVLWSVIPCVDIQRYVRMDSPQLVCWEVGTQLHYSNFEHVQFHPFQRCFSCSETASARWFLMKSYSLTLLFSSRDHPCWR